MNLTQVDWFKQDGPRAEKEESIYDNQHTFIDNTLDAYEIIEDDYNELKYYFWISKFGEK